MLGYMKVVDDELNVLPISSHVKIIQKLPNETKDPEVSVPREASRLRAL